MIARASLLSLEAYARQRGDFRARAMAHKKRRSIHLGDHLLLQFEDELTIRYQVQEMLRIERIFEDEGIQGELGEAASRRLKAGARLAFGVNQSAYQATLDPVPGEVRAALLEDLA